MNNSLLSSIDSVLDIAMQDLVPQLPCAQGSLIYPMQVYRQIRRNIKCLQKIPRNVKYKIDREQFDRFALCVEPARAMKVPFIITGSGEGPFFIERI